MPPAAEAQETLEASAETLESKARSVLTYSPDEIFQKSWQVREKKRKRIRFSIPFVEKLLPS